MHLSFRRLAACVLLASASGLALAQTGSDEASELLAKAIKAHGGEEYLTKHKAARSKIKGTLDIVGMQLPFTQESVILAPNKFRSDLELEAGGKTLSIRTYFDGKTGAIYLDNKKFPNSDAITNSLRDAAEVMQTARLIPLTKQNGYELNLLGESTVNNQKVVGLRVAKKGSRDLNLYFDAKTHLLTKIESRTIDSMTSEEFTEDRIVNEYHKVDGIPTPKTIVILRDGKRFLEAEQQEHKALETVGDDEFALPKE